MCTRFNTIPTSLFPNSNGVIFEDIEETFIRTFSGVKICTTIMRLSTDFLLFRSFFQFFIVFDLLYFKNKVK